MFDPFLTEKQILRKLGGDKNRYSIIFDGNTEGKVFIPLGQGIGFCKVSNKVLTKEELLGATFVDPEKTNIITEQNIIDNSAVGVSTKFYGLVTTSDSNGIPLAVSCEACSFAFMGGTVVVPEDGTYFYWGSNGSVTLFVSELSNETIVPIDQKYLPGVYEKTMLYDGTPTKMDLSSAGMGYAYLLSGNNLFALARGQNVHFEYTLANGTKAQGVLDNYDYMKALAVPMVYGAFTLLFSSNLGGTGVSFNYADIGEIANLKLWTEYSENKPYYVTGYYNGTVSRGDFIPVELEKAKAAAFAMRLMVRYKDSGGNTNYYIPTEVFDTGDLNITVTRGEITVTNDYISAGW